MNPTREEALFALALEKPVAKRTVFLEGMCEGDAALRARLDGLLSAHEQPETRRQPRWDERRRDERRRDELRESPSPRQGSMRAQAPWNDSWIKPTVSSDFSVTQRTS